MQVERSFGIDERHEGQPTGAVGILIGDAISRRLVWTAAMQFDLRPQEIDAKALASTDLSGLELIVADEMQARAMRFRLGKVSDGERVLQPALIAVLMGDDAGDVADAKSEFQYDGVLVLPQKPAALLAQLGLILYAHRAFAQRYQSALEELHLNRRIFRSVTNGISVCSAVEPDLPLVYVNPAFEAMTGYSLEEAVGRNCRFLQNGDHDQPCLPPLRQALKAKREVTVTIKNFRKDGSAFWNELSLSPIYNREREVTHFVGIQQDVTARVELEAALRESEKLAAVGRLAASIAHEINNPLESVMNLLYLARQPGTEVNKRDYLEMADKELQRVAQITSQSLRFYKQSARPQAVHCGELIESVLDVYKSRAENLAITIERRERMQGPIVCLESEIRQVLSNLVRNGMDAMNGRAGRLLVRLRESTEWKTQQRGAMITVADTGSGISRAAMDRMYTAFFTTKGMSGTGLGLWVSAEIVKRHFGRLRVRSCQRPEKSGTVFQLFLPYHAPQQ